LEARTREEIYTKKKLKCQKNTRAATTYTEKDHMPTFYLN